VIGAGAAGMMCAAQAGQRGRRVVLIEHYHTLGEKIRISGGGRCNFTNTGASPAGYLSQNPDFCRSALARYTARDFVALVERHGIAYHEKKLGQSSRPKAQGHRMLKAECDRGCVEWRMPCVVAGVDRVDDAFVVTTAEGTVRAGSVVIATGGLTVPKIGATPFGYKVAAQFGLNVVPPRPALVPLAFAPEWLAEYGDLAGIALDVEASCNGGSFRENLLFTHRGLSLDPRSSFLDGSRRFPSASCLEPGGRREISAASARRRRRSTTLAQRLPVRRRMVRRAWRNGPDGSSVRSRIRRNRGRPASLEASTGRHPRL
jgi:predicted Rossmann fold flavoprotein